MDEQEVETDEREDASQPIRTCPNLRITIEQALLLHPRTIVTATADRVITAPNHKHFVRGMRLAQELIGDKSEILMAYIGATLYIYKCTEKEALQRLNKLRERVRPITPNKVLVQMFITRARTLNQLIQKDNNDRDHNRKMRDSYLQNHPNETWEGVGENLSFPKYENMEETQQVLTEAIDNARSSNTKHAARELKKVFLKRGMDLNVLHQIRDLFSVESILTS